MPPDEHEGHAHTPRAVAHATDGHDVHDHHAAHGAPRATPGAPAAPGYPAHPESGHVHDKHAGHSVAGFREKFWISALLTVPTLIWGHMLQRAFGFHAPMFTGSAWIPAVFGTAVFAYGGWPFLEGARHEIRTRLPGMMTLIALAISVAFVFSAAVTLGYPGMPLWEELATLVTVMLLGHWLEMRSISQAQGALGELAKLLPDTATRVIANGGERTETVPIDQLRDDDVFLVRPGESVPADGIVLSGRSSVNEAVITGESRPVEKSPGEQVIAGTTNGSGSLRVRVTGTGERTALAGIMRLVHQAQTSRSRAQALADRAAFWLTWVALGAGAVTLVGWLVIGATSSYAIERLVTVLVIACPHALGLAIPLVVSISTTLGARNGLLVRDRRGLEDARNVDTVVFDKTGTLTRGEFGVTSIVTASDVNEDEALRLGAAIEADSEHPIAQGIVRTATERAIHSGHAEGFAALPGRGVRARVDGRTMYIGGPALLRELGVVADEALHEGAESASRRGQSVVYLVEEPTERTRRVIAAFAVADVPRPESHAAVRALHNANIDVVMMTGDATAVAQSVAQETGIATVFSEVLPEDKAGKVAELQRAGRRVAMVGDGVNDSPALVTADVGIAIGAGTGVAVEAGDIVLVRGDPRDVVRAIALSRASYRKMVQNLWWAAGYNIVAIPLAAGVLAPRGVVLSPAAGALLMSVTTIIVAANAQLLRRAPLTLR